MSCCAIYVQCQLLARRRKWLRKQIIDSMTKSHLLIKLMRTRAADMPCAEPRQSNDVAFQPFENAIKIIIFNNDLWMTGRYVWTIFAIAAYRCIDFTIGTQWTQQSFIVSANWLRPSALNIPKEFFYSHLRPCTGDANWIRQEQRLRTEKSDKYCRHFPIIIIFNIKEGNVIGNFSFSAAFKKQMFLWIDNCSCDSEE